MNIPYAVFEIHLFHCTVHSRQKIMVSIDFHQLMNEQWNVTQLWTKMCFGMHSKMAMMVTDYRQLNKSILNIKSLYFLSHEASRF